MNQTTQYKALLVDLDGTLYRAKPVQLAMALELLVVGLHRIPWLRAFRKEHEKMRIEARTVGAEFPPSPFRAQLRRTATKLGISEERLEPVVMQWMFERPGKWLKSAIHRVLVDELRAFRKAGGRTALVSDYPARRKLEALGVLDLFDQVIANGETDGLTRLKPDPDGYLLAAQRLGVAPEDCLVIGDREDADGLAAERAKMAFRLVP